MINFHLKGTTEAICSMALLVLSVNTAHIRGARDIPAHSQTVGWHWIA